MKATFLFFLLLLSHPDIYAQWYQKPFPSGETPRNPFNAISNFEFEIATLADVSLTIHDLLGQEVTTIVDDRLTHGSYTRQWDASGQPSGVYFYRLRAGDFAETKRLILLK